MLRFHFMARNELLGKKKFQWAQYLSKSMEKHIEEMIEINWLAWVLLIGWYVTYVTTSTYVTYAWVLLIVWWAPRASNPPWRK